MATPKFFPTAGKTTAVASLAATTASAEVVIGVNNLVRIISNQGVNVKFGPSGLSAATAADMYIAPNVPEIFDLGQQYASVRFFNSSSSAALIWVTVLSRN